MSMLALLTPVPLPIVGAIQMPGFGELMVMLVIALVVFGPNKLPQIGEALGKSIRGFKKAVNTQDEIDVTPSSGQISEGAQHTVRSSASEEQGARKA